MRRADGLFQNFQAAEYLDKHNVYDLFADLLDQLAIHKPADPIQFLIDKLRNPPGVPIRVRSQQTTSRPGQSASMQFVVPAPFSCLTSFPVLRVSSSA